MALPDLLRRLFADEGRGSKLRSDILPDTFPAGGIIAWSGTALDPIPSGWALCDGTNGTPDLRDRFIVGAGGGYVPGATGGSAAFTASATVGATTLSTAQMPSHGHGTNAQYHSYTSEGGGDGVFASNLNIPTASIYAAGGSGSHTHSLSAVSGSTLPPFFSLCYIMKL